MFQEILKKLAKAGLFAVILSLFCLNSAVSQESTPPLQYVGDNYPQSWEEYQETKDQGPFVIDEVHTSSTQRPKVLYLIVHSSIIDSLESTLDQFYTDLEEQGYFLRAYSVSGGEPSDIRSLLQTGYSSEGLEGCILMGRKLPVAFSEIAWRDAKVDSDYPIDLYYMDLDGEWIDADADNWFDDHLDGSGDVEPEIYIGRLAIEDEPYGDKRKEWQMIRNYLQRDHKYRIGELSSFYRALVFIDDSWRGQANDSRDAVHQAYPQAVLVVDQPGAPEYHTTTQGYRDELSQSYEFVHEMSHSNYYMHAFQSPEDVGCSWCYSQGSVYSDTMALIRIDGNDPDHPPAFCLNSIANGAGPQAIFYNLISCTAGNFMAKDYGCYYLAGHYIFRLNENSCGLGAIASTKIGGMGNYNSHCEDFYEAFANGMCIGEAFLKWFVRRGEASREWHYGLTYFGDPTLHQCGYVYQDYSLTGFPVNLNGPVSSSPVLVDLDGDGKREVIVGSGSDSLYVLGATGQTIWTKGLDGGVRTCPAIGDLNGDGDLEIVITNSPSGCGKLWVLNANDGTNFGNFPLIMGDYLNLPPALGDLDGDGQLEIVIAANYLFIDPHEVKETLKVIKPNGSSLWSRYSEVSAPPSGIALGDLNEDVLPDVIVTADDSVIALEGMTGGRLWSSFLQGPFGAVALADLDRDGDLEVVVGSSDEIFVLEGGEGGVLWTHPTNGMVTGIAIGDIDADSDLEIVAGSQGGTLYVLDNSGSEKLTYPIEAPIFSSPALGDIDEDEETEIVVSTFRGTYVLNPDGSNVLPGFFLGGKSYSSVAIGDINDDENTEAAVDGMDGQIHVYDFWGNPDHTEWGMYQHDRWHTGLYGAVPTRGASGHITENTTWSERIVVLGDVTVDSGVVLTVQPSTEVLFMPNQDNEKSGVDTSRCELIVQGELVASGAGADSVVFSSPVSGGWYGVRFKPEGQGHIQGAIVKNGYCGVFLDTSSVVTIEESSIRDNQLCGIRCDHTDSATAISDNTISGNNLYGVYAEGCSPSIIGNSFPYPNQDYAIRIVGDSPDKPVVIRSNNILMPVLECNPPRGGGDSTGVGIYIEDATAQIEDNQIIGGHYGIIGVGLDSATVIKGSEELSQELDRNCIGLALYAGSRPIVSSNQISDYGDIGVACYQSCPLLGDSLIPGTGNNSITPGSCSPQYAVYCEGVTDTIKAEMNFWGGSPPDPAWFYGPVDYDPWLTSVGVEPTTKPSLPDHFSLSQNYPNPINSVTQIKYALPEGYQVSLKVYNILGQLVRTLVDEGKPTGYYSIAWDGRTDSGEEVASGVYIYRIRAGGYTSSKKLVVLR